MTFRRMFGLVVFILSCQIAAAESAQPEYSEHIAPLLQKYCAGCHNADDRQGKLSVETFAQLQEGGKRGPAILPGEADASRLLRVLTGDADPRMPPEDNEAPNEQEVALLKAWIAAGAKGPQGEEPMRKLLTPELPAVEGTRPITSLDMAPNGMLLAVGRFGEVELRGVGGVVRRIANLPGKVNSAHFTADGSRLVVASGVTGLYGVAGIWNVSDGSLVRQIQAHRDTLYDAALSPNGKVLATCSYDRKIMLWNAETGEPLRTLTGHNDAIYDLAFSPDGSILASASGDETVKLWRVDTGQRLDTLGQPQAEQYVVTFSPDGKYVLAGGADNRIRVWRFVSKDRQQINPLVHARFAHEGAVTGLAFSRDGSSLVSAAEDRTLKLWETESYTQVQLFESQPDDVTGLAALPLANSVMVGRLDGSLASYEFRPTAGQASVASVASIGKPMPVSGEMAQLAEAEPNDTAAEAMPIALPAKVSGVIHPTREGQIRDADLFKFTAMAGQQWVIETNAARQKSPIDTKVEVLDANGQPVLRTLLRAVRDSYFTFRGQNSDSSDGFRLHNWEEMDVNQFLYAGGEVSKLWHYPRGPDSGFQIYPGRGKRFAYFDTTATSHPLQEPCYIVEAHPPGTTLIPNGLPTFKLYYENDDESRRKLGADSQLTFTAPADGDYLVRVTDTRSFSGEDFKYDLVVRPRRPDFKVSLGGANPTLNKGSGKEFTVTAERIDGFEGEIRVDIAGLPPGVMAPPLVIEQGQTMAFGTINVLPDAAQPTPENAKASKVTATATINGQSVTKDVNNFGEIKLAEKPKVLATVLSSDETVAAGTPDKPLELVIAPGETITARVRVERSGDFKARVGFGNADSGRNLPHGVYVDNIGLNGLLIVEGQEERTFFITAASWVPDQTRMFHLRAQAEGNQTTWPIKLHVRRRDTLVD